MQNGRPKGTANTPTGRIYTRRPTCRTQDLIDTLEDLGYDVVAKLIATIEDPRMPPGEKMRGLLGLMTFIFPRRKAVDLEVVDMQAVALALSRLAGQDISKRLPQVSETTRESAETITAAVQRQDRSVAKSVSVLPAKR
jgi:hypothetical protein